MRLITPHVARRAFALLAIASLAVAGCVETEHPLPPAPDAKVNVAYLGVWNFPQEEADKKPLVLTILKWDDRNYYVEFADKSRDEEPLRMAGYIVNVNGVDFAFVRELKGAEETGTSFLVLRIENKDGKLSMRHLKESFFKEKKTDTPEALRAILEANLDNNAMYETANLGTRVEKK